MKRIRIAIDPYLIQLRGPEIHWCWRLLLTGIGWPWEEVAPNEPCDVAYVVDPYSAPCSRLCIIADDKLWSNPSRQRLQEVICADGLPYFLFNGQPKAAFSLSKNESGTLTCRHDLLFDLFWLATGQEEQHWPQDRYGFFDLSATPLLEAGFPRTPLASQVSA